MLYSPNAMKVLNNVLVLTIYTQKHPLNLHPAQGLCNTDEPHNSMLYHHTGRELNRASQHLPSFILFYDIFPASICLISISVWSPYTRSTTGNINTPQHHNTKPFPCPTFPNRHNVSVNSATYLMHK